MSMTIDVKKTEAPHLEDDLSNGVQEEEKVEPERITEPLNTLVIETPAIIDKKNSNEKKVIAQSAVESLPQNNDSTPAQSKTRPDLEEPEQTKAAALPSKTIPSKNDDPGAVIDWLLKSQ